MKSLSWVPAGMCGAQVQLYRQIRGFLSQCAIRSGDSPFLWYWLRACLLQHCQALRTHSCIDVFALWAQRNRAALCGCNARPAANQRHHGRSWWPQQFCLSVHDGSHRILLHIWAQTHPNVAPFRAPQEEREPLLHRQQTFSFDRILFGLTGYQQRF